MKLEFNVQRDFVLTVDSFNKYLFCVRFCPRCLGFIPKDPSGIYILVKMMLKKSPFMSENYKCYEKVKQKELECRHGLQF
jgi:hypothetical protein